ncbi:DUF4468 domain-containing protein [Flavobacterium ammonificans]|uniref:DUF4468 domain-containing protein n=1 Tax=Flavobacterium ammonificans TaxID=1751056 RepID=A0ABN6KSN4_9FLAO|nr:DUF4468 domain-containing protein [Flavobacterium ammonificans]BDB52150.1 hypothetical protein GENT11_04620 [Flavobacterium ammonificans]
MKKLLILSILLTNTFAFSQTINNDKNGYYEIIEVDSLSKAQIYNRSKEWIALNYKSANDVIQFDTKDQIIVKGVFKIPYLTYEYTYNHSLIMYFKENRFKVEIILNSMHSNLSTDIINVENGFLSTNSEEIFERIISNPLLQEENIKKTFLEQFKNMGFSENKALKEWDKNRTDMLSSIPKSTNDIDIKTITQYVESIRIKVKNIFNSIEESFNNKNSNDGW